MRGRLINWCRWSLANRRTVLQVDLRFYSEQRRVNVTHLEFAQERRADVTHERVAREDENFGVDGRRDIADVDLDRTLNIQTSVHIRKTDRGVMRSDTGQATNCRWNWTFDRKTLVTMKKNHDKPSLMTRTHEK